VWRTITKLVKTIEPFLGVGLLHCGSNCK
jgi:hypothetical protein